MKLCKKKISILLVVCSLILVMVFVLCSFSPPSFTDSVLSVPNLNSSEVELIFSVFSHMYELGYFNTFIPVVCFYSTSLTDLRLYCINPSDSYQLSSSSLTTSSGFVYRFLFTADGFVYDNFTSGSSFSIPSSRVLFSRPSVNDLFTINPSFGYSSGSNVRDSLIDMANYWFDLYNIVTDYEEDVSSSYNSGFNIGYESGYTEGESVGYQDGYTDGFDTGFDYGEQFGYQDGLADGISTGFNQGFSAGEYVGYETGYQAGYDNGYENGYDDGYDSGLGDAEGEIVTEIVTEIVYRDPVEVDIGSVISGISSVPENILNGTFDFELFGINVYGLLKLIIIIFVVSAIVVFIIKRAS